MAGRRLVYIAPPTHRSTQHAACLPSSRFPVPISQVTGRSVLLRMVKQGIPSAVDSSRKLPESVTITLALEVRHRKSRYPNGSINLKRSFPLSCSSNPNSVNRALVRGWTGKTSGSVVAEHLHQACNGFAIVHVRRTMKKNHAVACGLDPKSL